MKAHRTLIRRFCLALITARTLAFALAPLADLQFLTVPGKQASVQSARDADGTGLLQHDPSTCVICAVMHDAPWTPSAPAVSRITAVTAREAFALVAASTPTVPQPGFLSRAPPAFG